MDMSKKSAKGRNKMDHSKMEGMKMKDDKQEEVMTDSAKG
jgi:hypothetical protein